MEIFKLFGSIGIKGAEEAKKEIDGVTGAAEDAGNKSQGAFGKLANAMDAARPASFALLGAVTAVGTAIGGLVVNGINLAGDVEQGLGGAAAVWGEYAKEIESKSTTAYKNMGLSQGEYLATANKMGSLFRGSGIEQVDALDLTTQAMERATDVASVMGIDSTWAMESITGAAKGNFTMMDNLGVAMNDTTLNAYAMEKGIGKTVDQMTMAEKVGLAMEMFMDRTAYAAGNYAKENDTYAGSWQTLKAAFTNVSAEIGERFLPALTDIFNKVTDFLENDPIGKLKEFEPAFYIIGGAILVGLVPALVSMASAALAAVAPLLPFLAVGAALGAALYFLSQKVGGLGNALLIMAPIVGTITALLIAYKIQQALSAASTTLWTVVSGGATAATTALGAAFAFLTSPIALVIIAIGALIAIGILVWKNWDTIKEWLITTWDTIKTKATEIFENIKVAVSEKFEAMKTAISNTLEAAKTIITNIWEGIKTAVSNAVNAVRNTVSNIFNAIKTLISNYVNGWKTIIQIALSVIKSIFSGDFGAARDTVLSIFNSIKDGISNAINAAKDAVKTAIDKIKGFFNFTWSLPKLKMPHFKASGKFSLNPPSVPKISVDWYAKGGILEKPTMFDFDPATMRAKVGGEAGPEAVAPIETLLGYIRTAVAEEQGRSEELLMQMTALMAEYLPQMANMQMVTDTGALVGAIAPAMDDRLGDIVKRRGRGNR